MYAAFRRTQISKLKFQKLKIQSGFSFIELLIVMVVMMLVFGISLSSYRQFQRKKAVDAFATQVKTDINLAREYALSGKKPTSGCTELDGYLFWIPAFSQRQYYVWPMCDGGFNAPYTKLVNWPPGIVMSIPDFYGINFRPLGKGVEIIFPGFGSPTLPSTITIGSDYSLLGSCTSNPWFEACQSQYAYPININITEGGTVE